MPGPIEVEVLSLPATSWWKDYLPIAAFLSGLLFPILIEVLKRSIFTPHLRLLHDDSRQYVLATKVEGEREGLHDAKYLRVGVVNDSWFYAKDVRAYIYKIEISINNEFKNVAFNVDSLRLKWSGESNDADMHQGIDLPNGVELYFDVLSTKHETGSKHPYTVIQCANMDARFNPSLLFNKLEYNNKYRITILLTAEGAKTKRFTLIVTIGSSWEDLSALQPTFHGLDDLI